MQKLAPCYLNLMKKISLTLCIFLLTSYLVHSQYSFEPGSIITNDLDTINGLIEIGNTKMNGLYCHYKKDSSSATIKYKPDDIYGYMVPGKKHYRSKEVEISEYSSRKLFLEYLVDGVVDLYYFQETVGNALFFMEKNGELIELSNNPVIFSQGEKKYIKDSRKYTGLLKYITYDYPSLSPEIDKVDFTHKALIDITKKYHDYSCDSIDCIIYYKEAEKLDDSKWLFKLGLSGGYRRTKLMFENRIVSNKGLIALTIFGGGSIFKPINTKITESNITDSYNTYSQIEMEYQSIIPGLSLNITRSWRTSLQLEVWYDYFRFTHEGGIIESKLLSIPLLLKREFFYYSKISPFITIGTSFNYFFRSRIYDFYVDYEIPLLVEGEVVYQPKYAIIDYTGLSPEITFTNSFNIGVGVSYDISQRSSINLELRGDSHWLQSARYINEDLIHYSAMSFASLLFLVNYSYHIK